MKQFPLILKSLLKQKAVCFLTVFQVAITFAVLVNSYASIDQYGRIIDDDMGIAQHRLVGVEFELEGSTADASTDSAYRNAVQRAVDLVKQLPDVVDVSATDGFPVTNNALTAQVRVAPDAPAGANITLYAADQAFLETLDVAVTAGRSFEAGEASWLGGVGDLGSAPPVMIVSRALADLIFPGEDPLNKQVFVRGRAFSVVGVADQLPGLHALWNNVQYSAYLPGRLGLAKGNKLLVRIDSESSIDRAVAAIEDKLLREHELIEYVNVRTLDDLKAASLTNAVSTLKVLGFISVVVLLVSALGIYGQAAFNVTKRTRETGIKRALGAAKGHVIGYYLMENWVISTAGIAFGLFLALVLNYVLTQGLGATKIDSSFIVPTVLFVWLIGFASSFLPARRAAGIPPAHATRTI